MHFCGGQVQSLSLIEDAASCPMEANLPPCHKQMVKQNNCCENSHLSYEGKYFSYEFNDFHFNAFAGFVIDLPVVMELPQLSGSVTDIHSTPYKPPVIERDIPVLIQSFLI
jgi:hypothetical protein